ncbi:hypothetical protein [Hymenobacter swuensis]|uniref:Uncharacterized protein n=1 Tax=Hymenobacter swuensis DY53 TaxID=1227739 RepID=W8F629_9BACT|nr:hypothetical protein [Hymenobacter swuensis]AHJ98066.1 hypothetical protein Hsw_2471 [Hymenobacter swuensis DY53]
MSLLRKPVPEWLLWVLTLVALMQLFGYLNLAVSYKYEVDITETLVNIHPPTAISKHQRKQQLRERGREIREAQFRSLLYAGLAAAAAVGLALRNHRLQTTSAATP